MGAITKGIKIYPVLNIFRTQLLNEKKLNKIRASPYDLIVTNAL